MVFWRFVGCCLDVCCFFCFFAVCLKVFLGGGKNGKRGHVNETGLEPSFYLFFFWGGGGGGLEAFLKVFCCIF